MPDFLSDSRELISGRFPGEADRQIQDSSPLVLSATRVFCERNRCAPGLVFRLTSKKGRLIRAGNARYVSRAAEAGRQSGVSATNDGVVDCAKPRTSRWVDDPVYPPQTRLL